MNVYIITATKGTETVVQGATGYQRALAVGRDLADAGYRVTLSVRPKVSSPAPVL